MTALRNRKVLVLNKGWNAIGVVTLERALVMLFSTYKDETPKARIIDPTKDFQTFTWEDWSRLRPKNGEDTIKGTNVAFRVPEVILLSKYDKLPQHKIHFSRRTIYKRDANTCFVPDTMVLMADLSLKPISEIQVGDFVLDAYGSRQVVEHVHSRKVEPGEVVSIKHRGNGDALMCTVDHKILPFSWDGKCLDLNGAPAGNLGLNSYLSELVPSIPVPDDCASKICTIDLYDLASTHLSHIKMEDGCVKHYSGNLVTQVITLDNDLGKLCGYYLSEGSVVGGCVTFTLNGVTESVYAEEIAHLLKKIFGLESKWEVDGNTGRVICNSTVLALFFSEFFGKKDSKRIGLKTNQMFLAGVLYGVCRGDAYFNSEQFRCTVMMSRPNLIRELYIVSLMLGLCPSLSKTGVRSDGRIYKSINFNAADFNKVAKMSNIPYIEWKPSKDNKKDRNLIENHLISKVTEVKQVDYDGFVYDLQVSGSHTYVANFVCVHNCQYCGCQPGTEELTIDHVLPRSRGGKTTWENCVLACVGCNSKKADRTPEECGMKLRKQPKKPVIPLFKGDIRIKSWEAFLGEAYWLTELQNDNSDSE